jgi:dihydrolipoamide dehydrogenase
VIVATGSVPTALPFLPFDEERVLSNTGALRIPEVPKHLIVIGGGVIGLELGSVWRRLGAKVTVIEFMPTILPGSDADVAKEMDRVLRKQGMAIHTGTKVTGGRREGERVFVDVEQGASRLTLDGDYVLVSIGRKPSLRGVDAAEVIAGKPSHMHYHTIPSIVYTWPETAACGLAEHEVKASGRAYVSGKFPFSANGRARTMGDAAGFVKFIADAATHEVLGCHIVGPNASELIAAIVLAMEFRASVHDVGETVHAHPTLSEAMKEAALAALGRAIHV